MPLGNLSTASRYWGKVSQDHLIPASIAIGEISSARSRLRITSSLSFSGQGASENPQFPITTLVTPCQQEQVPIGSQKTCASMWVCAYKGVRYDVAFGGDDLRGRDGNFADGSNSTLNDAEVGLVTGQTGTIHDGAVANHDIVLHLSLLTQGVGAEHGPTSDDVATLRLTAINES